MIKLGPLPPTTNELARLRRESVRHRRDRLRMEYLLKHYRITRRTIDARMRKER